VYIERVTVVQLLAFLQQGFLNQAETLHLFCEAFRMEQADVLFDSQGKLSRKTLAIKKENLVVSNCVVVKPIK
jgi:hypothetical protein